jgi:hypothetical protein
MNNDLLKISLNQGKQFKDYQTKINKNKSTSYKNIREGYKNIREGFVTSEQELMLRPKDDGYISVVQNQNQNQFQNQNQKDLDELQQLQTQYNDLAQQYTTVHKKINDNSLSTLNRISSSNPYLGKVIQLQGGSLFYVTNQGVAKQIQDMNIYGQVSGKNGFPPQGEFIQVSIPWDISYVNPGVMLPTTPPLLIGSPVQIGEGVGNEGKNVYTSRLVDNPASTYVGCYNDKSLGGSDERAMLLDNTAYTTIDNCQQYALDNGYSYFGMQNYQTDGTAQCLVSNDLSKTQAYGDASNITQPVSLWTSNTSGQQYMMQISGTGQILILDSNNNTVSAINDATADCANSGKITVDTATYGGNCKNIQIGNVTDVVSNKLNCNNSNTCSIPISSSSLGDFSTKGCWDSFDVSYKCGGTPFTRHLGKAEGQTMILDCQQYIQQTCQFYMILQDDGNLSLYKGVDPSTANTNSIWSSMTNGKQKGANPDWVSTKGKFGRNYLKTGEVLAPNEWVGSTNGSLKLLMQPDGNLVLYTSEITPGCSNKDGKMYGVQWVNAVYKLNEMGYPGSLGKVGYIDGDSTLREYPDTMLTYSNDYILYKGADSGGNDISSLELTDQNGCELECNKNNECAAYVFQSTTSTCWLKNKNAYPNGKKQTNSTLTLGVRKPKLISADGLKSADGLIDMDTIQYNSYIKGENMTSDTQLNVPIVSKEDLDQLNAIETNMSVLGKEIASKMETLYSQDNKIYEKLDMDAKEFNKNLAMYKNIHKKIKETREIGQIGQIKETKYNTNIEGMNNMNMNNLDGMVTDSDLRVLQENYNYILWSILAVGILTITLNVMKK